MVFADLPTAPPTFPAVAVSLVANFLLVVEQERTAVRSERNIIAHPIFVSTLIDEDTSNFLIGIPAVPIPRELVDWGK